ncbi:MAG: DUF1059 domain-containing protein [Nanoarchaeota archaeon]|nr:DUF1059 domain-containing protein [Nanoarchaeota archaeon]
MKTMTCEQLGGACDKEFRAETFEEMTELSKNHGMEMVGDEAHREAMHKIMELMKDPSAMNEWIENKNKEFDELPKSN